MSVFCVNRKAPEFIELSKEMNIHPDSLEMYIHSFQNSQYAKEYLNENGELPFPSKEYLKELLYDNNNSYGSTAIKEWADLMSQFNYGDIDCSSLSAAEHIKDIISNTLNVNINNISLFKTNNNSYPYKVVYNKPILRNYKELQFLLEELGFITNTSEGLLLNTSMEDLDAYFSFVDKLNKTLDTMGINKDSILIDGLQVQLDKTFKDINIIALSEDVLYQKSILEELKKLKSLNYTLSTVGNNKKIKEYLKRSNVSPYIQSVIIKAIEVEPKLKGFTALQVFNIISRQHNNDIASDYNNYIEQPIINALEKHLKDYISKYHIEVLEDNIPEELGVLGVYDILNKTIHIAKNRNAITFTEEFAHAFVELMGAKVSNKPENRDYTFLYKNVESTSIYKQVYALYKDTYRNKETGEVDIDKIKKEAIGQALAVAINNKWENKEETESSFWQTLKEWFNKILDYFTDAEYINFDTLLNKIAQEIVVGDTTRLNKIDSSNYSLLDYAETFDRQAKIDGGKALDFMQTFSKEFGCIITGSLAYRAQGTVYRSGLDALHDIDMRVPKSAHNIDISSEEVKAAIKNNTFGSSYLLSYMKELSYFKSIKAKYPNITFTAAYPDKKTNSITVNSIYSENQELVEKFASLSGSYANRLDNFTEEERKQIYLFDFFIMPNDDNSIEDTARGLKLLEDSDIFASKLEMGRAKDIFDYQMYSRYAQYKNNRLSPKDYLMYQKLTFEDFNPQQQYAVTECVDFLTDKNATEDYFLISGKAGTGKTTIINEIVSQYSKILNKNPKFIVSAVSNKAVENLYNKIDPEYSKEAASLAKLLGFEVDHDPNTGAEIWGLPKGAKNIADVVTKSKEKGLGEIDLLFVDEASMIDDFQFQVILTLKDVMSNLKIIMLGDIGQIDPIQSKESPIEKDSSYYYNREDSIDPISAVFLWDNKRDVLLTERMRQGEASPILSFADQSWNTDGTTKKTFGETVISEDGSLIFQNLETSAIVDEAMPLIEDAIQQKDASKIKFVTFKNDTVDKYNSAIYKKLHPSETSNLQPLHAGDIIMYYNGQQTNIPSAKNPKNMVQINNSADYSIIEAGEPYILELKELTDNINNARKATNETLKAPTVYAQMVKIKVFNGKTYVETEVPVVCPGNRQEYILFINSAWMMYKKMFDRNEKKDVRNYLRTLTYDTGNVKLGFAITVHKSQGSTYETTIVDYTDITSARQGKAPKGVSYNEAKKEHFKHIDRMIYTACTRSSNITVVLNNGLNPNFQNRKSVDLQSINDAINAKRGKAVPQRTKPLVREVQEAQESKKSWESVQKEWQDRFDWHQEHFEFVDTEDAHEYWYYPDGKTVQDNKRKADCSVTTLTNPNHDIGLSEAWLEISSRIGRTGDTLLRDYYENGEKSVLRRTYPNLTSTDIRILADAAKQFKQWLDNQFGNTKYQIVTKPYSLMGYLQEEGGTKRLVGGTVDMLIYDENGDYYIWDFKTSRKNIKEDNVKKSKYFSQVNSYRELNELLHPELKGHFKGGGLFQLNVDYPNPENKANRYTYDRDQVLVNGYKIQDAKSGRRSDGSRIYKGPRLFGSIEDSIIPIKSATPRRFYYDSEDALHNEEMEFLPLNSETNKSKRVLGEKPEVPVQSMTGIKLGQSKNTISRGEKPEVPVQSMNAISFGSKKSSSKKNDPNTLVITNNARHKVLENKANEVGGVVVTRQSKYGNPFSHEAYNGVEVIVNTVAEATQAYEAWLRGTAYQEVDQDRRQKILDAINNGELDGKPLVYYTNKVPGGDYFGDDSNIDTYDYTTAPNHAHILLKLRQEHLEGKVVGEQETSLDLPEGITIAKSYTKDMPTANPNVAFLYTENAQAYTAALELEDDWIPNGYQKGDEVKTGVSDVRGTNQAGIRASSQGTKGSENINPNVFGIIVKKYQQKKDTNRFLAQEGCFKNTKADFELFKKLNIHSLDRLQQSGLTSIQLPSQIALGKASLPKSFALWLIEELNTRFNLGLTKEANLKVNPNDEYSNGYGIDLSVGSTLQNNQEIQQSQQKLTSEAEINIDASTDENADLSNFDVRPFSNISLTDDVFRSLSPYWNSNSNIEFQSVEQAFQFYKLANIWSEYMEAQDFILYEKHEDGKISDQEYENGKAAIEATVEPIEKAIKEILNTTNGDKLKQVGNQEFDNINPKVFTYWDAHSSEVMKALLKASFEQNPQALQRLLNTGNATLTHKQATGKWRTEFPKLLMEVRDELRENNKSSKSELVLNSKNKRYSYIKITDLPQLLKESAIALQNEGWNIEAYEKTSQDGKAVNPTIAISFKGHPEKGFFELVQDREYNGEEYGKLINEYSIHFKTKSASADNDTVYATVPLEKTEKEDLFLALIKAVPEGAKVSTWGELTKGGIHALESLESRSKGTLIKIPETRQAKDTKGNDIELPIYQKTSVDIINNPAVNYTLHSGGAEGADSAWEDAGKKWGLGKTNHYYWKDRTPRGNTHITKEQYKRGVKAMQFEAFQQGKTVSKESTIALLSRNYTQVENSDAIFAIATLTDDMLHVEGGTGWACGMAVSESKPVYVFDQNKKKWYYAHYTADGKFTRYRLYQDSEGNEMTPILTQNFAGIGTRTINAEGLKAIEEVYNATFNTLERQRQLSMKVAEVEDNEDYLKSVIAAAKNMDAIRERVGIAESFFTAEEIALIKKGTATQNTNGNLESAMKIKSASRHSDPAFFKDKVIRDLQRNAELDFGSRKRFYALEVWSKHDGLPIIEILEACKKYRVAPIVSFSISSLGNSQYEPGVMKYNDLLDKIAELIQNGYLDPTSTTIRIDPIVPGVTSFEDYTNVVRRAKDLGITKFVTSIMQSYGYTEGEKGIGLYGLPKDRGIVQHFRDNLGYDWNEYYGYEEKGANKGKVKLLPKPSVIKEWRDNLKNLQEDLQVTIKSCAFNPLGLEKAACLDPDIVTAITGIDNLRNDKDTTRKTCQCMKHSGDSLAYTDTCLSSCGYCYGAQMNNDPFNYYDEEGNLIDHELTTTKLTKEEAQEERQKERLREAKRRALTSRGSNISTLAPSNQFSDTELQLIKERDELNHSTLISPLEVQRLATLAVFKFSDIVTKLQTSTDNNALYFPETSQHYDTDFTRMSRIEVIDAIGTGTLFEIVKNTMFNSANREDWDQIKFSNRRKLTFIKNHWGAFLEMTEHTLINQEQVSFGNMLVQNVDEEEILGGNAEESAEIAGSTIETWQIGFRQISAHNSLSLMLKQFLSNVNMLDSEGNIIYDDFHNETKIDAREAINKILLWSQGSQTLSDMISKLEEHVSSDPWMQTVIDALTGEDETFKSQFFSNFKKYFQPYIIQYIDSKSGQLMHKVINNKGLEQVMMDEFKMKWQDRHNGSISLYNTDGKLNSLVVNQMTDPLNTLKQILKNWNDVQTYDDIKDSLRTLYSVFDIEVDDAQLESLMDKKTIKKLNTAFTYIKTKGLDKNLDKENYDLFSDKNITKNLETIFSAVSNNSTNLESVSYESGKLHYSYVTPSYLSNLVDKLTGNVSDNFSFEEKTGYAAMLEKEYGQYSWFKTKTGTKERWRLRWLDRLEKDADFRENFGHYVILSSRGINYRDKSPLLYELSMLQAYFSGDKVNYKGKDKGQIKRSRWALFRIPMMSNKPSEEYIRAEKITDDNYKEIIIDEILKVVEQEIDRIATVRTANANGEPAIKNFSGSKGNGLKFVMIEYLQSYLESYNNWDKKNSQEDDFGYMCSDPDMMQSNPSQYLRSYNKEAKILIGKELENRIQGLPSNPKLDTLLRAVINTEIDKKYQDYRKVLEQEGVLETNKAGTRYIHLSKCNMGIEMDQIDDSLENFFWNDMYAAISILEMTVTDTAYYKDTEDLQKRLAQIHAPGLRCNTEAMWYDPKADKKILISDGKTRTIYLSDFDKVVSDAIENVRGIFDARYEKLLKENPEEAKIFKETAKAIIENFKEINVTDAQGYSSITSYRKKAIMFGKWSNQLEETYQRIKSGNYTTRDLNMSLQPLKPFVYSQTSKSTSGTLEKLKVGVQNKNSEYLLIMMDAILQGEQNKQSVNGTKASKSMLSAIYQVMEESHYDEDGNYRQNGIDTVQFESTVKAGLEGKIDITPKAIMKWKEQWAKKNNKNIKECSYSDTQIAKMIIEDSIYENGRGSNYKETSVHELEFEDYCLQSEVPAHLEGDSIFGSQLRMLIIADMPEINADGSPNMIDFDGEKVTVKELKSRYMKAISDNIYQSCNDLIKELKLDGTQAEKNIALSKLLQETIRKDGKYGYDLLYAVSTDEYGRFNIPLSDPIQAGRIQQLLNSIIKSRINKQMLPGGPVVQVTNFGTSSELSIRFKDKEGNPLPTLREFYEENKVASSNAIDRFTAKFGKVSKLFKSKSSNDTKEYSYTEFIDIARYENSEDSEERALYNKVCKSIIDRYRKEVVAKQAAVDYMECYAPSTVFKEFADENGFIDINKIPKDMLKAVGFRIPTEAKYSMAPLKIVGLLPIEAGEGIMLPKEITLLSGSDKYQCFYHYNIKNSLNCWELLKRRTISNQDQHSQ